ncbi:MAG: FCD domain-containing protein, partial [Bacillota bacterium]
AGPDLLEEMGRVVDRHQAQVSGQRTGWQEDVSFHRLLARAAGNRLLLAASELVREEGQLSPVLEYIRGRVGSVMVADHRAILERVRARDPEGAARSMARHIDNIIADVVRFWEQNPGGQGKNTSG